MTLDDKTLRLIDQLLTYNESVVTTLYYDYNELEPATRAKKWKEHYAISKILKDITGVNAYHQRCKEEAYQKILEECEKNKEIVETLASTVGETLESIKNPQCYRNYKINKEATSPEELFEVTIEHEASCPPVEPTYPNPTKEEWLASVEHAKEYFQEEYNAAKKYALEQEKMDPEVLKASRFCFPPVLKEVFVDENILALTKGFMLGPVGLFNNKAVQAGHAQRYDNIFEMEAFLKAQSRIKDIVVYLTYKEGDKYYFRGAFVDKE